MDKDGQNELSLVMQEVVTAMGGSDVVLTLHPSGGGAPQVLHRSGAASVADVVPRLATAFIARGQGDAATWHRDVLREGDGLILIPVSPIAGHSRLVIGVIFDLYTDAARAQAETVYALRKPFAVGYFRLWQLNRMRDRQRQALESALDLTDIGVVFLDRAGMVTFTNVAAEKVLGTGDGLRRVDGCLRATTMAESVRLQVALNHVIAAGPDQDDLRTSEPASILAIHRREGAALIVSLLAPAIRAEEPSDVAAIMFIVDPQADTARALEPVCRLYNLSPAETRLVTCLARGKTLIDAAERMRVKEQTVRSYMKSVFLKTGTNRQTELVVLMLSSVVRMRTGLPQKALSDSDIQETATIFNW